jgi:hypothetical protein
MEQLAIVASLKPGAEEEGRKLIEQGPPFESNKVHAEFGFRLAFTNEPDGSVSWVVLAEEGLELASGVADTWDDARLAVIERLYPPSGET